MKVFLGGTCGDSDWREKFIPLLKIDYFNPVVKNWTEACKEEEIEQRRTCDFLLYVITPCMTGTYSIAEVTDDSNKNPSKTILVVLKKDEDEKFDKDETKSLTAVQALVTANGGQVFNSLKAAAEWINQEAEVMTYAIDETLDGRAVQDTKDSIEEAFTAVDSLESLIDTIEECRDVGLEAWSAQFVGIHVGAVKRQYGIKDQEVPLPSLEAFHSKRTFTATSVTLESIAETVEKVWMWIKEKIGDLVLLFQKYWQRLTKSLDYVENEAGQLKKHALSEPWSANDSVTLSMNTLSKLAVGGSIPTFSELLSKLHELQQLNHVSKDTLSVVYKRVMTQYKNLAEMGNLPYKAEVLVPQGWTEVVHSDGEDRYDVGDARTFVSPTVLGNTFIRVTAFGLANQEMAKDTQTRKTVRYKPEVVRKAVSIAEHEVPSLSSKEVATLCDTLIAATRAMKESRKAVDDHLHHIRQDLDTHTRQWQQRARRPVERDVLEIMKQIYFAGVVYGTQLSQACENVAFGAMSASLTYAKVSAKRHAHDHRERLALPAPAL